ncbi:MAG TPA: hypothetical protein VJU60_08815 [Thermoleophilaceae bacterium]|nr:hypothetical protein [Thermoleophilaceae bacterium]
MRAPARRAAILAAALAITPVLFASAAHADSLVYMNGGNVWISHGDGSNPRQVTGGPNTWSWPTEDDSGNILVAGGQENINAGIEDTAGSEIHRMNQQGAELSAPQQTPGSMSSVACPTYPPVSVRVAPDGQHYAYHAFFCDHFITFIGTVGGAGFTDGEYMEDFMFPYWVNNSAFLMTRGGVQFSTCDTSTGDSCEWWTHDLGDATNNGWPWFSDDASSASGFDGIAISRDGTKFASIEDDGANYGGAAQNVELRLWAASGAPTNATGGNASTPTLKCTLNLPDDPQSTLWYYNAGPTFSPDGTRIAFAEPDGVHIADVSNLNSCPSSAPLVIPGATQPFWSGANEAANAGYVAPTPGPQPGPVRDTTAPVLGSLGISPKRFAVGKKATALSAKKKHSHQGAMVRYTLSEPARVSFAVERSAKGHKKGRKCVKAGKRSHGKACVLWVKQATLTRAGISGANQLAFSGRLGHRKLAAGSYELVAQAVDAAGNKSAKKVVRFTIVRR